jgi:hypothetical protein
VLLAVIVVLLPQNAGPDLQQVFLRVVAQDQRCIEEEVPASDRIF